MLNIKLVVIGSSGVGKTSLRFQYTNGYFTTVYPWRIDPDFITKSLPHPFVPDGEKVALRIWDTAGQERFSCVLSGYFRGADAVLLVFDATQPRTLMELGKWWSEFKDGARLSDADAKEFSVVVAGNKIDLIDSKGTGVVLEDDAETFLRKLIPTVETLDMGPRLFWTSAKTGEGVKEMFEYVVRLVVTKWEQRKSALMHMPEGGVTLDDDGTKAKGFDGCCS